MDAHPSPRLTVPHRLRLAVARVVGERTMLRLARWACGLRFHVEETWVTRLRGEYTAHYRARYDESDRKRRALARRRWGRRAKRRDVATWNMLVAHWRKVWEPVCAEVLTLTVTLAPSPTVCQPGADYAPASVCDLGYEVSGDGPRRE